MIRTSIVIAAGLAFATMLPAISAHAAARDRVFVASYGNDANPCTFGSPCKTFQNALTVVAAGGEITAIDSAGFGPVTINKAVTITSPNGVEAGIAPSAGGNAITIAAQPNDVVSLRGLTLEGAATGRSGIVFDDGGGLEITDCVIRNFTQTGISIGVGSSPILGTNVVISNTRVLDNPTAGIDLEPQAGAGLVITIDHVTANNNGYGIFMITTNAPSASVIWGTITNSVINSNVSAGFSVTSAGGVAGISISVKDSTISNNNFNNSGAGISVSNDTSSVVLSHSLINNNGIGILLNGGFVFKRGQ